MDSIPLKVDTLADYIIPLAVTVKSPFFAFNVLFTEGFTT